MNSKKKGSSFEREIAKKLSLWFSDKERDDLFWRTSNSGGRSTQRFKKGLQTLQGDGDICSVSPEYKNFNDCFYIELKNYKTVDLWGLITKNGNIIEWWTLAKSKADEQEKIAILIIKANNKPILFISSDYFRDNMIKFYGIQPELSVKFKDNPDIEKISNFHIYFFDKIIDLDPEVFKSFINDICGKL